MISLRGRRGIVNRDLGLALAALIAALALTLVPIAAAPAAPESRPAARYEWHAGDDFLAAFGPGATPAVARAGGGERVEVKAWGTLAPADKEADGGGTYVRTDASGNEVDRGEIRVVSLVTFRSFGDASPQGLPDFFEGGLALLRVELRSASGEEGRGMLWVTCALGNAPPGHREGVRLSIAGGPNFELSLGGRTLFIRTP
ncbi:MAG: hypothetical protein A3K65_06815 [Euryarchaeota archaeon RBG_16_68_12]|nr:MAG: hypothetical protein A3K65_06815 [Euryarchaeota archaeon RBG_16_68_12]